MRPLLQRQEINNNVSRTEFLADMDCLLDVLRDAYGLYEYFGHDAFALTKEKIVNGVNKGAFDMKQAFFLVQEVFASFIEDGHFRIGAGG